jgi:beta-galactosidase
MVKFQPGTLEAIGFCDGRRVARSKRKTTGAPSRIVLTPDRQKIRADGADVASITASVVDDQNRPVPTADNLIHFEVTGAGRVLGVGNGDPSSHESDKATHRRLFNGLALVLVQSLEKPGTIILTASSDTLATASIQLPAVSSRMRLIARS